MSATRIELIQLLTPRLERLSVDSIWARRASGLRRSLVKAIEADTAGQPLADSHLDDLIERTFEILTKSAREIPDPARQLWQQIKKDPQP
jgi:hypothetical protein